MANHMNHAHNHAPGGAARIFSDIANVVARQAGRPGAFSIAALAVIIWLATGPLFNYSDTWQLVINTGTTIVTFLMVFLIQNSQNRDNAALQVKLDELIRSGTAQNFYIGVEHLTDDELDEIRRKCEERAAIAAQAGRHTNHKIGRKAADATDNA
jgi:low affinity Fe/Cu permease